MAYKYQPIKDEIFVSDNEEEPEDDEEEEENNIDIADEFEVPTACPRSLVKIFIVTYYVKWVKTCWTYSMCYYLCKLMIQQNRMKTRIRTFAKKCWIMW